MLPDSDSLRAVLNRSCNFIRVSSLKKLLGKKYILNKLTKYDVIIPKLGFLPLPTNTLKIYIALKKDKLQHFSRMLKSK